MTFATLSQTVVVAESYCLLMIHNVFIFDKALCDTFRVHWQLHSNNLVIGLLLTYSMSVWTKTCYSTSWCISGNAGMNYALKLNNQRIVVADKCKYLGVIIGIKLTSKAHIDCMHF